VLSDDDPFIVLTETKFRKKKFVNFVTETKFRKKMTTVSAVVIPTRRNAWMHVALSCPRRSAME